MSIMFSDEILNLHLKVLAEILKGKSFEKIKNQYSEEFKRLNYLQVATGPLLTFQNEQLIASYPISPRESSYIVNVEGVGKGYAMCAIDALGVAYTFMKKTTVETTTKDTEEVVKIEVDPNATTHEAMDVFVTYTPLDSKITNAAVQQCPSINFYRDSKNIPEQLQVLSFQDALSRAKEIFSQQEILNCIKGTSTCTADNASDCC